MLVGEGVAKGVFGNPVPTAKLWYPMGVGRCTADGGAAVGIPLRGEPGDEGVAGTAGDGAATAGGCTDAITARLMKPGAKLTCAGAVLAGCARPGEWLGVRPEGTSMKVFFTGSGTPALVSPSVGSSPPRPRKAASERGAGRFGGMAHATRGSAAPASPQRERERVRQRERESERPSRRSESRPQGRCGW